jgi:hypothetical protein
LREAKVWVTKKYGDYGRSEVVFREHSILEAMFRHFEAVRAVDDPESIITTNTQGVIYGFGYNVERFKKNKTCSFKLRFILY